MGEQHLARQPMHDEEARTARVATAEAGGDFRRYEAGHLGVWRLRPGMPRANVSGDHWPEIGYLSGPSRSTVTPFPAGSRAIWRHSNDSGVRVALTISSPTDSGSV